MNKDQGEENAVGTGSPMRRGETEQHRQLKELAVSWAWENGFAIAAREVRVPQSGYRADVAACSRGAGRRTALFECKQARADLLKDARREDEARAKVAELGARLKKLEELIGGHRPDLRRGDELFPEFAAWDFSGLEHGTHRKVVADLARWQERLAGGTKFAKLWRWRAADFFYLVTEAGIFAEAEVPAGWGLLVRVRGAAGAGDALTLLRPPVWAEASAEQRLALLENIALGATRRRSGAAGAGVRRRPGTHEQPGGNAETDDLGTDEHESTRMNTCGECRGAGLCEACGGGAEVVRWWTMIDETQSEQGKPAREVMCADAMPWMRERGVIAGACAVTSLPDVSEVGVALDVWRTWFLDAVRLVVAAVPAESAALFFQSDIKREGEWIDKGALVIRAAEEAGARVRFHKIVCRRPPGMLTNGRPGFTHFIAVSRAMKCPEVVAIPDVIVDAGEQKWVRAMGVRAAGHAVRFARDVVGAKVVFDPFCGVGTVLAVANALGLAALGVEKNRKRAEQARALTVRAGEL